MISAKEALEQWESLCRIYTKKRDAYRTAENDFQSARSEMLAAKQKYLEAKEKQFGVPDDESDED